MAMWQSDFTIYIQNYHYANLFSNILSTFQIHHNYIFCERGCQGKFEKHLVPYDFLYFEQVWARIYLANRDLAHRDLGEQKSL